MGREMTLKRALREPRREHDIILIDCPPALGLLTVNALVAATHALISAEGEYFSLQGVEQVLEVMSLARENLNEDLEWLGVVLNSTDLRTLHAREAHSGLRASFGEKVFDAVIRKSVRYPESAERGLSILDYRPELGADYIGLGEEVLSRLGEEDARSRVEALRPPPAQDEEEPAQPADHTPHPGGVTRIAVE
jgi:chromosome partitioning protein